MSEPKFGLMRISRSFDGVKFVKSDFNEDEMNRIMIHIVRGNPIEVYTKLVFFDGNAYLQHLEATSELADIAVSMVQQSANEDSMIFNTKVLKQFNEYANFKTNFTVPSIEESVTYFNSFGGLDGFFFSLFGGLKFILLGKASEVFEAIVHLLNLLPRSIARGKTFHTFSERLDESMDVQGMPAIQQSIDQIAGRESEFTIVSLPKRSVFSPYSSPISAEIAKEFGKGYMQYKRIVNELFQTARDLSSIEDIGELADRVGGDMSAAEFMMRLIENVHGGEIRWRDNQ